MGKVEFFTWAGQSASFMLGAVAFHKAGWLGTGGAVTLFVTGVGLAVLAFWALSHIRQAEQEKENAAAKVAAE